MIDFGIAAPKAHGSDDRTVPLEATHALLPGLRRRFGITRVGELTRLDRCGVPTYCAVVPRSRDRISIYNGKGPTRAHALVGAVMEAVERQVAAKPHLAGITLRPSDVARNAGASIGTTIDLREFEFVDGAWDLEMPFVRGVNLLDQSPVLVPIDAVRFPQASPRTFRCGTTNGLASGNTVLEATHHALHELVERHLWSITHARAHVKPRRLIEAFTGARDPSLGTRMVDDPIAFDIDMPTGDAQIDELIGKFRAASLQVRVLALIEAPLPVTIVATIVERDVNLPPVHLGFGCSWSPRHAVMRALNEAAQSRLGNIQAAREDQIREDDPARPLLDRGRRRSHVPAGRWYVEGPGRRTSLDALVDRSDPDLAVEVRRLLDALAAIGVTCVAAIDLTPPDLPVSVIRVIAPGLESTMVDGRIGPTMRRLLDVERRATG